MLGVVVGEMFASQRGLRYAMHVCDIQNLTASSLVLAVLAVLSNSLMLAVDRRLHRAGVVS